MERLMERNCTTNESENVRIKKDGLDYKFDLRIPLDRQSGTHSLSKTIIHFGSNSYFDNDAILLLIQF